MNTVSTQTAALKVKGSQQPLPENPVILRALRRLKDSQEKENHVSHYTKHGSHATHSKGSW